MSNNESTTFHLGITMAGAVSAGAYTAGFMDYLIEALELWEEKKTHNRRVGEDDPTYDYSVPMHDVVIDALGGASAGGMVGMITALSTYSKMKPVHKPTDKETGNILYDSWVLLDDDIKNSNAKTTFEKMLSTVDLEDSKGQIKSLLNSSSIDAVANKVFDQLVAKKDKRRLPKYLAEDLHVLLTLCSIRGIPFEVKFDTFSSAHFPFSPGHRMHEHMIIAHFKFQFDSKKDKNIYLKFDPYDKDTAELMKLSTIATGAFPIGLEMRHFKNKLTKEYIKNNILRNLEISDSEAINIYIDDGFFDFTDVDGGTINNEPYSQVVRILEKKGQKYNPSKPLFGTIMIDPFPNFYNQDEALPISNGSKNIFQKNIWDVLGNAYNMFQQQVRVKREGALYKDYFRMLVFPLKRKSNGELEDHPPLASSLLGGFGGFLSREFRKHDFFLGRDNARNFLRGLFMLEYVKDDPHPLFKNIRQEVLETYRRIPKNDNPDKKVYLPIIPDVKLPKDKADGKTNPFSYTYKDYPRLSKEDISKYKPEIKKRIRVIITNEINNRLDNKWFWRLIAKLFKGKITNRISAFVINKIIKDLSKRKQLK